MRMELHRMTHDIRHLVVAPVVEPLHRVQDAALHGLQAVVDVRHGTLENHIRGIVEEPMLVHPREVVHRPFVVLAGHAVFRVLRFALLLIAFRVLFLRSHIVVFIFWSHISQSSTGVFRFRG